MPNIRARSLSVAITAALAAPAMAAQPITATFDLDAEGFQGSTISTVQIYLANGGNPDGHIELRRDLSPPAFNIGTENMTTPDFLGDYAAGGITGAGFDLNVFNTTLTGAWLRFRDNVAVNGWHYDFGAVTPDANQWKSYDVLF